MKQYKTLSTVILFEGEVGLTPAQAEPRSLALKAAKKGVYKITGEVQFKAGEVIGLGTFPKAFAGALEPVKQQAGTNEDAQAADRS